MKTLFIYEGSPDVVLKHCTYNEEKKKLRFEGHEITTGRTYATKNEMKDWVRDYIENYCKIHKQ